MHLPESAGIVWPLAQLTLLAVVLALERAVHDEDRVAPAAVGVVALALGFLALLVDTLEVASSERAELALGGAMLAVLVAGLLLRHRGIVVGAAVALCVDAIVFAFDLGGFLTGTGILVALAAALAWQAENLRGYFGSD